MRRLVINLDDSLDEWLKGEVNQNETVRNALHIYKDDITTPNTVAGIQKSYRGLATYMQTKFASYDESFKKMDKLVEFIETRMM